MPWNPTEPSGFLAENCAGANFLDGATWDVECNNYQHGMCQGIKALFKLRFIIVFFLQSIFKIIQLYTFRGLCKSSLFDNLLTIQRGVQNRRRYFQGYFGWKLLWEDGSWFIKHKVIRYMIHVNGKWHNL